VVIPIHDNNPTQRRAVVTLLIIAINVVVYLAVQPHGGGADEARFTYEHAAIPCELEQDQPLDISEIRTGNCDQSSEATQVFPDKNVWLAVLLSMFLHGSILHLAGNMWFLWIFGNNVEDYLGKIGFVLFYLLAGAAATAAHVFYESGSTTPVIGASGAIAGVMGMYLVLWPRARVLSFVPFFFIFLLPLPAAWVLLLWFVLQFLTGPNTGVAWFAHVGGFLFGAAVGLLLKRVKAPTEVPFL
jgi:membrane associated rhomboid family serine protease